MQSFASHCIKISRNDWQMEGKQASGPTWHRIDLASLSSLIMAARTLDTVAKTTTLSAQRARSYTNSIECHTV